MIKSIFVYGTLKKKYHNNRLLGNSTFVGEGTVKGTLHVTGLPYLRPGNTHVHGEIYEVNEQTLGTLDSLEGHPNWYKRTPMLAWLNTGDIIAVEAYVYQRELSPDSIRESGRF